MDCRAGHSLSLKLCLKPQGYVTRRAAAILVAPRNVAFLSHACNNDDAAPMAKSWTLHPQLADDTCLIGDLPLSQVRLMNDANYPWVLLVPRRAGASEIIDLDRDEQAQLMTEIAETSRTLKAVTRCDKLNVAAIGNVVPQLHVHIVARSYDDAAWPKPVWGAAPPRPYQPAARAGLVEAFQRELSIGRIG
jgi:diadenosine tetraphosphate (Ap4A) HIT family hydrolase